MVNHVKPDEEEAEAERSTYTVPGVLLLIFVNLPLCYMYGIYGSLYSYYVNDEESYKDRWTEENMFDISLTESIKLARMAQIDHGAMWADKLMESVFYFALIMFMGDRWTFNGYKAEYLVELGVLGLLGFETVDSALRELRNEGALALLLAGSVLFGVYHVVGKKLSAPEKLLYFPLILALLAKVLYYFFAPNPIPVGYSYSIENYKQISPTLKDRVVALCKKYDVGTNNVLIEPANTLNAYSQRCFQYKLIGIHSHLIDAFTEDQVMAVVCHEIGHILRFDSAKLCTKMAIESGLNLACAILIYRTVKPRCNGLMAIFIYYNARKAVETLLEGGYNFFVGHGDELGSDMHSLAEGLGEPMEEALKLIALSVAGLFFDFNTAFSLLDAHPSSYKRLTTIRRL